MRKMAKLLVFVMVVSLFASFAVTANAQVPTSEINFNDKTLTNGWWGGSSLFSSTSTATGAVVNGLGGQDGYAYAKIDDEHGASLAMSGGAGLQYVFNYQYEGTERVKQPVTGYLTYGFDVYAIKGDSTAMAVLQFNDYTYNWDNSMIATIYTKTDKIKLPQTGHGETVEESFAAGTWYRVDLFIEAREDSAIVDVYINGKYKATRDIPQAIKSVWLSAYNMGVGTTNRMVIDNIRAGKVSDMTTLTANPTVSTITEDATSASIRFSGTLNRASVNDEPIVTVSEKNLDTNTTRTINATAEIDYTATKLNVLFGEALDDNCEYTITLPTELKGLKNETLLTESVTIKTKIGTDYFDNFDHYTNAQTMPRFSNREFSGATGYGEQGQALTSEYNQNTQYNLHEAIVVDNVAADYIVSFDMKIPDDSKTVQLYVSYNSGSAFQWKEGIIKRDWNNAGTFTENEWHHYDLLFDFDKSIDGRKRLYLFCDGVQVSGSYSIWGTLSYVKLFAETTNPYHIDNFHARYANEVDVETTLNGNISAGTKTATIKFDDAVDKTKLTKANIIIEDDDLESVEYTIKSADIYGMTIEFADGELLPNKEYTLVVKNMTAYAGETLDKKTFHFSTFEKFEVTDARILDGNTEVSEVSAWDNTKAYEVELTLDSTETAETTINAIVAGYTAQGEMVNVAVVPFTVTTSDVYKEELMALDMTGATTIKVFVINSLENLAPLMENVTILD